jgi:metal-sulfur cluster biosynthetic enzyme
MSLEVDLDVVWENLGTVMDPELGVAITDLGLIYSVEVEDGTVRVVMTTTTPLCPLGAYLEKQIRRRLMKISSVEHVVIELVHDPLWRPDMMNETARRALGTRFAPPSSTLTIRRPGR